jgi:phosphoribosylformylglycinamidine synthase
MSLPASGAALPQAWRIEVFRQPDRDDAEGASVQGGLAESGCAEIASVRAGRGYLLSPELSRDDVESIARRLLCDPVLEHWTLSAPGEEPPRAAAARASGKLRLLVAPRPGVMDPVALTLDALLARALPSAPRARVSTYRAFELTARAGARLSAESATEVGRRVLANETIEILLAAREDLPYRIPGGQAKRGRVDVALLAHDDAALEKLSKDGLLSLSLLEMRAIQQHYRAQGRDPSALELETLAQTWSEHCKHKTFTSPIDFHGERIENLFKSTIVRATRELARAWCVSVFHDNAGVISFDQGWDLCLKVETHNHPSAIDPYGGAGTGVGGVVRDILGAGLGARPIANTDAFFVGPPDLPDAALPKGCMHPRRILRGVVAGVRDYGNRMGIPTVNGGVWYDPRYVGNPLVYCGTLGLIPHARVHKEVHPGDIVVAVGGRTGRDGIHGATFSSLELHEDSEVESSSAVQIGNPIEEKRFLDCLLEARDRGLYRGITDCGAGGFSSAVGELGADCGVDVDLERVPLKYPGLASHEIWISEAQERMVLAVPPARLDALLALFAAEEVEATAIGRFTDTQRLVVRDAGAVVGDLDMHFLHHGLPRGLQTATYAPPSIPDPGVPACRDVEGSLLALLAEPNVASKEWIVRQYDHEVQGMSVVKPFVGPRQHGPSDAAVLQPLPSSNRGAALALGACPRYGLLDPHAMALAAIDEALRNAVCVGGDPERTAILDNFSWGNCKKPDRLGALVLSAKACYEGAVAYGTPFISGKDSLNNEYRVGDTTIAIPPTLLVSALALVPDLARCVTMDLKRAGGLLYVVGLTRAEFGGSLYLEQALGGGPASAGTLGNPLAPPLLGGRVPRPDLDEAPRTLRALHAAIRGGLVASCHDLSEGGLAVAAAEMALAGRLGLELELARVPCETLAPGCDALATRLYSESCTRFLVEVAPQHAQAFEHALAGRTCAEVGRVAANERCVLRGLDGAVCADLPLERLEQAFRGAFQG